MLKKIMKKAFKIDKLGKQRKNKPVWVKFKETQKMTQKLL